MLHFLEGQPALSKSHYRLHRNRTVSNLACSRLGCADTVWPEMPGRLDVLPLEIQALGFWAGLVVDHFRPYHSMRGFLGGAPPAGCTRLEPISHIMVTQPACLQGSSRCLPGNCEESHAPSFRPTKPRPPPPTQRVPECCASAVALSHIDLTGIELGLQHGVPVTLRASPSRFSNRANA